MPLQDIGYGKWGWAMCRIMGMCMELMEWVMGMGVKSNRNNGKA